MSTLFIVSTPMGNLGDMSFRAVEILKSVDIILAEDTRHTQKLLNYYEINLNSKMIRSCHEHNEKDRIEWVISQLQADKTIALVSDAGTPLISDPGFMLVQKVKLNTQFNIIPIPGPCASIAALSASGLPSHRFSFEGFLPVKPGARLKLLNQLKQDLLKEKIQNLTPRTLVFYVSTHRLKAVLDNVNSVFGEGYLISLAKELTKAYENIITGSILEIQNWLAEDINRAKGEFVLLISGDSKAINSNLNQNLTIQTQLNPIDSRGLINGLLESKELSKKSIVNIVSKLSSVSKKEIYQWVHQ